jgi:hypothetical protein
MLGEQFDKRCPRRIWAAMILATAGLVVMLLSAAGPIHILQTALCAQGNGVHNTCKAGGLSGFTSAISAIEGPATIAIGSVSLLGVLAGGALWGIAHPSAGKTLAMAGGMGLVVLLARGIVA